MASAQTALDLLVLTVLGRRGPLHGYGIANAIEELPAKPSASTKDPSIPPSTAWRRSAGSPPPGPSPKKTPRPHLSNDPRRKKTIGR